MRRYIRHALPWVVSVVLALGAGYVHLAAGDPTLSALLVAMIAMGMGLWQPERSWRWALVCSISVPLMQAFAFLRGQPIGRGAWQGAFAIGMVSGIAGATLGALFRRVYARLAGELKPKATGEDRHS